MKLSLSALVSSLLCISSSSACSFDDCKNVDHGSCGNACCKLDFVIHDENTVEVMNKMNATLVQGGHDGLYIPMPTYEGTLTFGDLREYHSEVDFIGQAWHTTVSKEFNDTLNFLLQSIDNGKSTHVTAFSISQIAGAYGDEGQNYYNLVSLMDSVSWKNEVQFKHADKSCPPPAKK